MTLADRVLTTRFPGRPGGRPGRPRDPGPAWHRPALLALLAATALLYLWDLSASGNANSFYAAAAQAGSKSWKAWFFGSLDSASFITVDKPPGALWVMGLSARLFGYSSWSLLVPQALEGIAAVSLLAAAVRRVAGPAAGLIGGAVLALTPAAVLIFRFDNPDALLVLLLVAAAYCVTRALEAGRTRWLVLAGTALGFAFLTKSGQALLPVPALGLAYLVAAPVPVRRRITQLLLAGLAMVIAAGWWIAAVLLTPAADRPYIGGSTDNNPLQLAFGYNGLDRLLGGSGNGGSGNGGGRGIGGGTSFGGATGLERLFRGEFGLEISWLLPAALLLLAAGIWLTWRGRRQDPVRAALIVWGGWLLVTAVTFSYMQGTIHPYYTVALAPAIAALAGTGGAALWQRRGDHGRTAWAVLALVVAVTAAWDIALLRSQSSFHPSVTVVVIVVAVLALASLVVAAARTRAGRRAAAVAGIMTILATAVPVASWGVATAATAHSGSIPTAVVTGNRTGTGGGFGGGGAPGGAPAGGTRTGGTQPGGIRTGGTQPGGTKPGGAAAGGTAGTGTRTGGSAPRSRTAAADDFGGGAGGGQVSAALRAALEKTTTRWAAATDGSQSAATLELATGGKAVMAIGGFTGTDPAPTLAQFKAHVAVGDITYYIAGGQGGPGGGSGAASQITSWVEAHYKATTIGGETVYVLHR